VPTTTASATTRNSQATGLLARSPSQTPREDEDWDKSAVAGLQAMCALVLEGLLGQLKQLVATFLAALVSTTAAGGNTRANDNNSNNNNSKAEVSGLGRVVGSHFCKRLTATLRALAQLIEAEGCETSAWAIARSGEPTTATTATAVTGLARTALRHRGPALIQPLLALFGRGLTALMPQEVTTTATSNTPPAVTATATVTAATPNNPSADSEGSWRSRSPTRTDGLHSHRSESSSGSASGPGSASTNTSTTMTTRYIHPHAHSHGDQSRGAGGASKEPAAKVVLQALRLLGAFARALPGSLTLFWPQLLKDPSKVEASLRSSVDACLPESERAPARRKIPLAAGAPGPETAAEAVMTTARCLPCAPPPPLPQATLLAAAAHHPLASIRTAAWTAIGALLASSGLSTWLRVFKGSSSSHSCTARSTLGNKGGKGGLPICEDWSGRSAAEKVSSGVLKILMVLCATLGNERDPAALGEALALLRLLLCELPLQELGTEGSSGLAGPKGSRNSPLAPSPSPSMRAPTNVDPTYKGDSSSSSTSASGRRPNHERHHQQPNRLESLMSLALATGEQLHFFCVFFASSSWSTSS
jgi:hypothetical protein